MKKLFIALLLLVFSIAPAAADPFLLDLDGDGDLSNALKVYTLQADATSQWDVTLDLGSDGIMGNGDVFTETYSLNILYAEDATQSQITGPGTWNSNALEFTASVTDVRGKVINYNDGGDATTAADFSGIGNDSWDLDFFLGDAMTGVGIVKFDYLSNTIGTFLVTGGGTDAAFKANTNGTLTGSTGVTMHALSLNAGYWYTEGETDMSTIAPQNLVIGLVDSGANVEGVAGDDGGTTDDPNTAVVENPDDDNLILTLSDNGDTIRISVVPEPTTIALFGFGLLGAAAIGRRKRS